MSEWEEEEMWMISSPCPLTFIYCENAKNTHVNHGCYQQLYSCRIRQGRDELADIAIGAALVRAVLLADTDMKSANQMRFPHRLTSDEVCAQPSARPAKSTADVSIWAGHDSFITDVALLMIDSAEVEKHSLGTANLRGGQDKTEAFQVVVNALRQVFR